MPDSHSSLIYSLQWSPDGKFLAMSTPEQFTLWDADANQPHLQLAESWGTLSWSPDSSLLLTGGQTTIGATFPISVRSITGEIRAHHGEGASSWNPHSHQIAVCPTRNELRIYHPLTGTLTHSLHLTHWIAVTSISWSPDGQWIATAAGNEAVLTNLASGQQRILTHTAYVCSLSWSPDSSLITTSTDEECRATTFQASTGEVLFHCDHGDEGGPPSPWIHEALWSPDGTHLVTGPGNSGGRLWSSTGELIRALDLPDAQAYAWHPSGRHFAVLTTRTVFTVPLAPGSPPTALIHLK
ncbi:MAG: hypothetical protein Q4C87_11000 [Actinomycetaceae bacterium]|nr:hypothetical protein [Actinomycetaceae bacterium]